MIFRRNVFIFTLFLWLGFNITKSECKSFGNHTSKKGEFNRALGQASEMMPDFPLGIYDVLDNASGLFRQLVNKILTKKTFLGIESFIYQ